MFFNGNLFHVNKNLTTIIFLNIPTIVIIQQIYTNNLSELEETTQ